MVVLVLASSGITPANPIDSLAGCMFSQPCELYNVLLVFVAVCGVPLCTSLPR